MSEVRPNRLVRLGSKLQDLEQPALVLLFAQSFFLAAAGGITYVAANTLFLLNFGSQNVPYVYIAIGIFVSLFFSGFAVLQHRWLLPRLIVTAYLGEAAVFFLAWLLLVRFDWQEVSFVLMVLYALVILVLHILIGSQAGRLLDVRQMKRLFPVVFASIVIGYVTGSLLSPILAAYLGRSENLLLVAAASVLIALAFFRPLYRQFGKSLTQAPRSTARQPASSLGQILSSRYTVALLSYQMLSAVGTQLIIYIFLVQADARYSDPAALTRLFGNFAAWRNVASLIFLLLIAGRLISRFGLGFGILANPISVAVLALGLGALAVAADPATTAFFWLVIAVYVIDNLLSDGITNTSIKAAYQALPVRDRAVVETAVEGIGIPIAFGVTGICLLLFNAIPGVTLTHILGFTLLVTVVWTVSGVLAYRGYIQALVQRLQRRIVQPTEISLGDAATMAVIESFVERDNVAQVCLALQLLAEAGHPSLDTHLVNLLHHKSDAIRLEAVTYVEARQVKAALPVLKSWLDNGASPPLKGAALRALGALEGPGAVRTLIAWVDNGDPHLQLNALTGLLRHGDVAGILAANDRLATLMRSATAADRILAARVVGQVQQQGFYRPLLNLLADDDMAVRRVALIAAGQVRHRDLLPQVIANLKYRQTRSVALAALIASGEAGLDSVAQALAQSSDRRMVRYLIRLCGQIQGPRAIDLLKQRLEHHHYDVLLPVLVALHHCGYRAGTKDQLFVESRLVAQVERGLRLLLAIQEMGDDEATAVLQRALTQELDQIRRAVFYLLSFLYNAGAILRVADDLVQADPRRRALAVETLEVNLSSLHKALVLPLVHERLPLAQRIQRLRKHMDLPGLARIDRLQEIITSANVWPHTWARTCAIYAAAQLRLAELTNAVASAASSPEPVVRETAAWAMQQFKASGVTRARSTLLSTGWKEKQTTLVETPAGEKRMLIIEKVALLRTIDIFANIPDYVLAAVATIVEEVELKPGETFIEAGSYGDCMYIVVEGEVRVHIQGKTIIILGPGKSVGELAVLDPEPRSAMVSAVDDAFLFRIDKEPFDEVMADRPEIAQGVIRALCRRVREQGYLMAASAAAEGKWDG